MYDMREELVHIRKAGEQISIKGKSIYNMFFHALANYPEHFVLKEEHALRICYGLERASKILILAWVFLSKVKRL